MKRFEIEDRLLNASLPAAETPSANGVSYQRRWRTPRPLACAVALIVGSVLAYGQFLRVEQHHKTPSPSCSVGWPYPFAWQDTPSSPLGTIRWLSLTGDVGWWLAMFLLVLITAERLAPRRHRIRLSTKSRISLVAAAVVLLISTDWMSLYRRSEDELGLTFFELARVIVGFCWLNMVALGVISSFTVIWNRSSHLFTAVVTYALIGLTVLGVDLWLYSNGLMESPNERWIWLSLTVSIGAVTTLLFGALVWLATAMRETTDNHSKILRSNNE